MNLLNTSFKIISSCFQNNIWQIKYCINNHLKNTVCWIPMSGQYSWQCSAPSFLTKFRPHIASQGAQTRLKVSQKCFSEQTSLDRQKVIPVNVQNRKMRVLGRGYIKNEGSICSTCFLHRFYMWREKMQFNYSFSKKLPFAQM